MSDSDNVKPGGLTETVLIEKVVFPLFYGHFHHFALVFTFGFPLFGHFHHFALVLTFGFPLFWTFSPF